MSSPLLEKKLFLSFAFALVVCIVVGALAHWNSQRFLAICTERAATQLRQQALTQVSAKLTEAHLAGQALAGDGAAGARVEGTKATLGELLAGMNPAEESGEEMRHLLALKEATEKWLANLAALSARRESLSPENLGAELTQAEVEFKKLQATLENSLSDNRMALERLAKDSARGQWILANGLRVGGGAAVLVLGAVWWMVWRDTRGRRKVEAELLASQDLSQNVIENSGECVLLLALDGRIVSINPEGRRLMELREPMNVTKVVWLNLWKNEVHELARKALTHAAGGQVGRFRGYCASFAGAARWWDVRVTAVHDAAEELKNYLVVATDITEVRWAEEKFRVIFEQSADAHLLFAEQGVVDCNRAAVVLLRYPDKLALMASSFTKLSTEYQPDGISSNEKISEYVRMAKDYGECKFEWQFLRADGEVYPVEVILTPVNLEGAPLLLVVWRDLTDRKRAEAALRESEERFQAFMDHSPTVAFIKDDAGRYIYVNKPFEEEFGVNFLNDLRGRTDASWLPAETARLVAENDHKVIATGNPSRMVEVVPVRDGEPTEWLLLKFPMRTSTGQKLIGGVGVDISKQKRAERALREREAQFRDLFDDAPVAYHELDTENCFTRVNATELAMLGYKAEEMVGRPVWDFIVQEFGEDEIPLETAIAMRLEAAQRTFRRKDGSLVPVLMRHKLITDSSGEVRGMRSTLQDISVLKRTERDLRKAEEKYRGIFENASEGIFQTTAEGQFLSVNPALARIYGYAGPEALMREVRDIARQIYVDPKAHERFVQSILEHDMIMDFEAEVYRKDGTVILTSAQARAVRDASGRLLYFEGTVGDITAKRESESAITKARDAALESVRLKSEFLANMSHEIRTPMNGIIGMSGLLMDTELSAKQRDFTQTICSSAEALLTIINDILDFSKIEAGMLVFEEIDFQLGAVVEGAVDLLAERALSKRLELASLVNTDVPRYLRGDPGRLRQVLTNLIGNAIKFTDKGEVVVRAETVEESASDVLLKFAISDTGIGISAEQKATLFQAFVQADGSTTRKYGGTGLGLAICRQLVAQMGGNIGIDSVVGQGSTFWFTARFPKQPMLPQLVQFKRNLSGVRVLIVDDNETNRQILEHLSTAWAMHQEQASGGKKALELLRLGVESGQPFDLVVLDMQMPEMDGAMLAREIKSDPKLETTRLVMMTSLDRSDDPALMRKIGIDAYLTKPVKQSSLFDCIASVVAGGEAPQRSALSHAAPADAAADAQPAALRPLRILIVEDNVVNMNVALYQLQKIGYTADTAENGRLALEVLQKNTYDVVLMDCQMPEMDGYEATRELRRLEGKERHTWVVAMTAHSLEGDRDKCLAAGMDDYVSKPVRPNDLKAALLRVSGLSPVSAGSVADPTAAKSAELRSAEVPAISMELLAGFREMDPDGSGGILAKLIDLFIENTPVVIADGRTAVKNGTAPELERCAHMLKGSCANFGAERMREACWRLEQLAQGGGCEGAEELLAEVEKEFNYVRIALERERNSTVL